MLSNIVKRFLKVFLTLLLYLFCNLEMQYGAAVNGMDFETEQIGVKTSTLPLGKLRYKSQNPSLLICKMPEQNLPPVIVANFK